MRNNRELVYILLGSVVYSLIVIIIAMHIQASKVLTSGTPMYYIEVYMACMEQGNVSSLDCGRLAQCHSYGCEELGNER